MIDWHIEIVRLMERAGIPAAAPIGHDRRIFPVTEEEAAALYAIEGEIQMLLRERRW